MYDVRTVAGVKMGTSRQTPKPGVLELWEHLLILNLVRQRGS